MSSNLEKRIERLQNLLGDEEKCLVILFTHFGDPSEITQEQLTAEVSPDGEAWVSPYYSVKFWGGTPAKWARLLAELRVNPKCRTPHQQTVRQAPPICPQCGAKLAVVGAPGTVCPACGTTSGGQGQ